MSCPAYRDVPTGLFAPPQRIACGKPDAHKGSHKSPWISRTKINELMQVAKVRVEWFDA